ncbi:ATP-dependent DNA helicase DDX11 [Holothuria leucospilota]|uniref:ATP-dependent DNA helicase DDX11 n=1 Tax=Holothuria leucospilota TaxID=206669 RepID=A0A9Q1BKQ4_HOLLE|nr:ATP-dependent DNA helicase DDX11 [Holothuria leucospilota]
MDHRNEVERNPGADGITFPFPFTPYSIQEDFMQSLYVTLQDGKVGIFESPTGTGKSLSLICGALTWLRDFEAHQQSELDALLNREQPTPREDDKDANSNKTHQLEPDWLLEFDSKKRRMEEAAQLKLKKESLERRESKLNEMRNRLKAKKRKLETSPTPTKDAKLDDSYKKTSSEAEDELLVADYTSEDDEKKVEDEEETQEEEEDTITKIFYCSRTHSQLSQFVHEVRKSPFGEDVRLTNLGSRQNLCINPSVKKLKSLTLINDKCLEMQKKKKDSNKKTEVSDTKKPKRTTGGSGCQFYTQGTQEEIKDRIAVEALDIEQLVDLGRELKACPYYGTRHSVPFAQIVVLSYNILLHKSTREACGIKLEGNVVIIDEAHNLLETISSVHSVEVTGGQVYKAFSQLSQYMHRYKSRLKAKNLMYIKQLLHVLSSFINTLGGKLSSPPHPPPANQKTGSGTVTKLLTINDFLFELKLDNINFFKLRRYCQRSKISQKLNGFVEMKMDPAVNVDGSAPQPTGISHFLQQIQKQNLTKQSTSIGNEENKANPSSDFVEASSPLMHIESFLQALTNADKDGRVVIYRKDLLSQSSLKFLLLNPAIHFKEVVNQARSVVIAGGTMQPLDEFKHQLFSCADVPPERILEFACGHVIPPDHLLPIALAQGPSGRQMDFTFQSRNKPEMLDELGRILVNLSTIIPAGLVCFFPSYEYADHVYSHWEKTGVLERLEKKKKIFQEPKKATQVEQILGQYAMVIKNTSTNSKQSGSQNGAILLSVVGGKMSEGINFSDDMGRCVVMVGLPYANIYSPELKEKMDYLNATMPPIQGKTAGQVHYDNICMKAVNQSIGRAIRHKGDYATIVLVDHRYSKPSIQSKLPGWIGQQLHTTEKFGKAFALIRQFFASKR